MYDTLLVPLDGSESAKAIVPHVQAMATGHEAEVILLEVLPATGVVANVAAKQRQDAEDDLMAVEEQLLNAGVKARHAVTPGADAAAEIVDFAKANDVDSIAMSTHGCSGVGRWLFGSVASKLLRGTSKAILLIRSPGALISDG